MMRSEHRSGGHPKPASGARGRAMQAADLRVNNLSTVLRSAVMGARPRSRAEIALDTGLTKPTVSKLVDQLIEAGVLADGEAVARGAGRPAIPLVVPPEGVVGIGLEIASDRIGVRTVDLLGVTVHERHAYGPAADVEPVATVDRAVELLADALALVGGRRVAGVCVSVPGRISADGGTVLSAPNLGWLHVPLLAMLTEHASVNAHPELAAAPGVISVHNDAQLAARFELGHRDEGASFVYVFGQTGIGGAIVIDGELYLGTHGWAGEIGHVSVEAGGALCRCGRRGCLEAHASYHALRARAQLEPEVHISDVVDALAARLGDRAAVIDLIGKPLGLALADTLNVLDLPTVVVGGYFAPILPELAPVLGAVLRQRALAEDQAPVRIEAAFDEPHPALSGAAQAALEPVLHQTAEWIAHAAASGRAS